jgi:hypothetical protein
MSVTINLWRQPDRGRIRRDRHVQATLGLNCLLGAVALAEQFGAPQFAPVVIVAGV